VRELKKGKERDRKKRKEGSLWDYSEEPSSRGCGKKKSDLGGRKLSSQYSNQRGRKVILIKSAPRLSLRMKRKCAYTIGGGRTRILST